VTGKVGPTPGLEKALKEKGIGINLDKTPLKGGRTGRGGSVNNFNGALGEKELANSLNNRNPLAGVKEQVVHVDGVATNRTDRLKGSRVVDVQQQNFSRDIHESKVGKTGLNSTTRSQLNADANIISKTNGIPSTWSHTARNLGKIARPVGAIMDGVKVYSAIQEDGGLNNMGHHTKRAVSEVAGGWAGALAGAAGGALAGSAFFGIGAVPGAIIGGIAGAFGGEWAGGAGYDAIAGR
jgi:hypothetical protein